MCVCVYIYIYLLVNEVGRVLFLFSKNVPYCYRFSSMNFILNKLFLKLMFLFFISQYVYYKLTIVV